MLPRALLLLALGACAGDDGTVASAPDNTCNGLDDDHDGEVDEDAPDLDGDGQLDCYETELCDGLDNDADGLVDEDFTDDADGDGVLDCLDVEECDGVDNDGDGEIDEDSPDADGDGIADCTDVEECDGVDNDGDGEVDEEFGDVDFDGVADCVDIEHCDGRDNDGDGEIDEGYDQDGDGIGDCDPCPRSAASLVCTVDLVSGVSSCGGASPLQEVAGSGGGWVLSADMEGWDTLIVEADVVDGSGWIWNVGNSPTNNGGGGDAATFEHDSEAQLVDGLITVLGNQTTGSVTLASLPDAVDLGSDHFTLTVCDQTMTFESTTSPIQTVVNPGLFRLDPTLPDVEAVLNDEVLWIGLDRVIDPLNTTRLGAGLDAVVITFAR